MAMVLPGTSISDTQLTIGTAMHPVTTPLFIGYVGQDAHPLPQSVKVASLADAGKIVGHTGTLYYALRHFFDNGGRSCYVLPLGSNTQWSDDRKGRLTALIAALQDAEIQETIAADPNVGLLVVPEISEINDLSYEEDKSQTSSRMQVSDIADLWYQGWQTVLQLCRPGQRKFALLELPDDLIQALKLTQKSFSADLLQHGAAWWPRLQTNYPADTPGATDYLILSPLPAVAAAIQCSALNHGVWKPPANVVLAKTLQPIRTVAEAQTLLTDKGVTCNVIRSFAAKGVKLWGCRTLLNNTASPWRYIQTRLLANVVENQLSTLAMAYLFEPNNALTWTKLKGQAWNWLRQQWLAGAFYGTVEEDAFSLGIGLNETMTPEDITAGKMIMQVQLALLAPAEFIEISLTLDMRTASPLTQSGA